MTDTAPKTTTGYACEDEKAIFKLMEYPLPSLGESDVHIKTLYSGICHSDYHTAKSEWGRAAYPCSPGHEIIGEVMAVGNKVTKFRIGDKAGVGCLVESCRSCDACDRDQQQYCEEKVWTYNSPHKVDPSINTKGGYTHNLVVNQDFVFTIPQALHEKLPESASLMCAGLTTYSPYVDHGMDKCTGKNVGVVGLGGLGHMAVKFGVAFGHHVTVFSRSESKRKDVEAMGAKFAVLKDANSPGYDKLQNSFDFIIDTVSAPKDQNVYLNLCRCLGKYVIVGLPPVGTEYPIAPHIFVHRMCTLTGSLIGGIRRTQSMLELCAEKKIFCDIEMIKPDYINQAWDRMFASDVRYRFVIDMRDGDKSFSS